MKLTFLGVGSAFAKNNANSNLLVESGDLTMAIDCGRSAPPALEEYGLSIKHLTHILITHLHADHIGGMEEVAFMTKLVYQFRVKVVSTVSLLDRLWNCSLRGGLEFIEESPNDTTPRTLEDYFEPIAIPAQQWIVVNETPLTKLYLHPTNHVRGMESYGVEMEVAEGGKNRRFLFSGDTKFDLDLIQHGIDSCGYVFHDCQLFDSGENNKMGVHASYGQLMELPPEIRKSLWLYHYSDDPLPNAKADGFAGFLQHLQSFTL